MFIKLTHGLHSVLNAIVSYIQKWTDDSVPDGTRTLHNFKDGQGKRPAVPLDELNSSNNIVNVKTDSKFEHGTDDVTKLSILKNRHTGKNCYIELKYDDIRHRFYSSSLMEELGVNYFDARFTQVNLEDFTW